MPIPFQCPHCGHRTQVADTYVGQSGPCAGCGATVTIAAAEKPQAGKPKPSSSSASGLYIALTLVLGFLTCGGLGVLALVLPAVGSAKGAAQRMQCSNNLKQIALAMHSYATVHDAFPPAYTVDADGNKLHSWRTLILPYLEQDGLYQQIDLNSAWDSPQNLALAQTVISPYCCPSVKGGDPYRTDYKVIVGPGTMFEGTNQIGFRDVTDGTANTILVVEVAGSSTSWMEPADLDLEQLQPVINGAGAELGSSHPGGMSVVLADGAVKFLANTIDPGLLRSLITRNDGNVVNAF